MRELNEKEIFSVIAVGVIFTLVGFLIGIGFEQKDVFNKLTADLRRTANRIEYVEAETVVKFKDGKVVEILPFKEKEKCGIIRGEEGIWQRIF